MVNALAKRLEEAYGDQITITFDSTHSALNIMSTIEYDFCNVRDNKLNIISGNTIINISFDKIIYEDEEDIFVLVTDDGNIEIGF